MISLMVHHYVVSLSDKPSANRPAHELTPRLHSPTDVVPARFLRGGSSLFLSANQPLFNRQTQGIN